MKYPLSLKGVPCNICKLKAEEIIMKTDLGNIVRCKNCGLFYRSPRLSDEDEIRRYKNLGYDDAYCEILDRSRKDLYLAVLEEIEAYKGKLLDVGCADGYFLGLAQKRGWEPYGVEISDFYLEKAKKNLSEKSVFGVPLKIAKFPSNLFDAVTLLDVLDHLGDPRGELDEIGRILKKKGMLIARVRNGAFHVLLDRLFEKNVFGIIPVSTVFHLYGFDRHTLAILLKKANFSNIRIENSKLTGGNPYCQTKYLERYMINIIKRTYSAFAEVVSLLSRKNVLISSSLMIYAKKK
ncbi:MAG: class I SAM-dependent methyltransferase [Candidatus Aminicenantes bacterium]|nr:class I SAM-dependent methyltransferase [Candidatus Aminicenantes bacterium]